MSSFDESVLEWVRVEMSRLLGADATEDVATYLLSMENSHDLKDYINDLLDSSLPENKTFISELLIKWQRLHRGSDGGRNEAANEPAKINMVTDDLQSLSTKSKRGKRKSNESNVSSPENISASASPGSGKKTHFVPLFSKEGHMRTVAMLPGRRHCDCQALKHSLVNNCLSCGRIVCLQEGPGPCLFCGALVCSKDQQDVLSRNSRKSEKLLNHLMNQPVSRDDGNDDALTKGYEKAVQHKNKLLEYDRTSVKRTQVIDDESDYFSTDSNQWLKDSEKSALRKREEELRNLRHASRKDRKVTLTLDFAGRKVIEEEPCVDVYNADDSVVQAVNFNNVTTTDTEKLQQKHGMGEEGLANPDITVAPPKFVSENVGKKTSKSLHKTDNDDRKLLRLQNDELSQMSDAGMVLSMHQPWASLLVCGIKRHEGRTWYAQHRGTLWIAATAKTPSQDDIECVENQYRLLYNDPNLSFPKSYPVGCLLGCVDVCDCLAREDYTEQHPDGESDSPYVFICENPRQLPVKFPMKGKHKIYKLESQLHKAAKKGLAVNSSGSY